MSDLQRIDDCLSNLDNALKSKGIHINTSYLQPFTETFHYNEQNRNEDSMESSISYTQGNDNYRTVRKQSNKKINFPRSQTQIFGSSQTRSFKVFPNNLKVDKELKSPPKKINYCAINDNSSNLKTLYRAPSSDLNQSTSKNGSPTFNDLRLLKLELSSQMEKIKNELQNKIECTQGCLLEKEIKNLKEEMTIKNNNLIIQIQELSIKLGVLSNDVLEMKSEIKNPKSRLNTNNDNDEEINPSNYSEIQINTDKKIRELKKSINSEMSKNFNDYENKINPLTFQIEQMGEKIKFLSDSVNNISNENLKMNSKLLEFSTKINNSNSINFRGNNFGEKNFTTNESFVELKIRTETEISQLKDNYKTLNNNLLSINNDLVVIKQKFDNNNNYNNNLLSNSINQRLDELNRKISDMERDNNNKINELTNEINNLKRNQTTAKDDLDTITQKVNGVTNEMTSIKNSVVGGINELGGLNTEKKECIKNEIMKELGETCSKTDLNKVYEELDKKIDNILSSIREENINNQIYRKSDDSQSSDSKKVYVNVNKSQSHEKEKEDNEDNKDVGSFNFPTLRNYNEDDCFVKDGEINKPEVHEEFNQQQTPIVQSIVLHNDDDNFISAYQIPQNQNNNSIQELSEELNNKDNDLTENSDDEDKGLSLQNESNNELQIPQKTNQENKNEDEVDEFDVDDLP